MAFRGVVFGWYHQRNAGDDRLAHCIERWLHDHELTFLPHTEPPPLDVLRRADYALLGGGSIANSVHGVFSGMRRWIAAAGIPVFMAGVSVGNNPAVREELRAVAESGGKLWVRDRQTAERLDFGRHTIVGPDLSWLFPLPARPSEPHAGVAVNLRPWTMRAWDPVAWGHELRRLGCELTPWALCFGKDADREALLPALGAGGGDEFDPDIPSSAAAVVAMRFHAVIFAVQVGTPVVAVANSRKLDWLMEQLGLAELTVPIECPNDLRRVFDRAVAVCDRHTLTELTARQSVGARAVADALKADIEAAATRRRARRRGLTAAVRQLTRLLGR